MITLKQYQHAVLGSIRRFFNLCAQTGNPDSAFKTVTAEVTGEASAYLPIREQGFAAGMPYVCVRVPTGGGKTLLAAHAAGIALTEFLPVDQALVLWLVPSNAILEQTAEALRSARHPYRRGLEESCGGPVEVLTIEEALRMNHAMTQGQTVVIVSTIQCFRVSDQTGRKVYNEDNTYMADHLRDVPPDRLADLDVGPDGKPACSLINVLRYRRPIVMVDEAHSARTPLSFSTLAKAAPSCIIEFTATPDCKTTPSNVLHRVSAAELKAEQMVKLPVRVMTREPGQREQLLAEALAVRADLQKLADNEAGETGAYLRPILLIQADRVDACAPLREQLVSSFGLQEEAIKISTGSHDDLKTVSDIESPDCPVTCIITVQKLREGWDCPFAYVLCSLRDTRSATAIEQIVGRILRMPRAKARRHPDLNCAYVFSLSTGNRLEEVLQELRDALEHNGFTKAEAERIVLPPSNTFLPLGYQSRRVTLPEETVDAMPFEVARRDMHDKVTYDETSRALTIWVPLSDKDEQTLASCVVQEEKRRELVEAIQQVREADQALGGGGKPRAATPYELQQDFFVPLLSVREEDQYVEFERTHLIEHPWKLSEKDASLPSSYDPRKRPAGREGVVDIGGQGELMFGAVRELAPGDDFVGKLHQQVMPLATRQEWTLESLAKNIDDKLQNRADISRPESIAYILKVLRQLMAKLGLKDVDALALDRFRLRQEIEKSIEAHRANEHAQIFQQWLLPESALAVTDSQGINFKTMSYAPSWLYEGGFVFRKHYFGPKPGELKQNTEEFACAQYLDGMPQIKCWVRNLARKPGSFRLQTSRGWFYPDFVCLLQDGRSLAVEYKGGNRDKAWYSMAESQEKRAVGALWESRSEGRCLFIMPQGKDWAAIEEKCG